uniref:Uncharacterized protein n=1 Tax=Rheinheimera sp. BAL341 TaxID=1708203 RepID=A0A486XWU4_9GAMM
MDNPELPVSIFKSFIQNVYLKTTSSLFDYNQAWRYIVACWPYLAKR